MFIIILHHQAQHGLWFAPDAPLSLPFLLRELLFGSVGAIGNWLFILISGYFISAKAIPWQKLRRLWVQVFMTSAIIGVAVYLLRLRIVNPTIGWEADYAEKGFSAAAHTVTKRGLLLALLPCYFGGNWFSVAYMVFLMLAPLLEASVENLTQEAHKNAVITLGVLGTVVPLLPSEHFFVPSAVFVFVAGFFIARYIRLYEPAFFGSGRRCFLCAGALFALICTYKIGANVFFARLQTPLPARLVKQLTCLLDKNESLPVMLCAVCIFCGFRTLRLPKNRVINRIAATTFGVYLLHENPLLRKWWWHTVCKLDSAIATPWLFGVMLLYTIVTFAVCSTLELFRKHCIEAPLLRLLKRKK